MKGSSQTLLIAVEVQIDLFLAVDATLYKHHFETKRIVKEVTTRCNDVLRRRLLENAEYIAKYMRLLTK